METTDRFVLPLIMPSQAQKHVTHNEAIAVVDGLLYLALDSIGLAEPPPTASSPCAHAVGEGASGAWAGHDGCIALLSATGWYFTAPREGMIAYRTDVHGFVAYTDADGWGPFTGLADALHTERLGVGAEPDDLNRLVVKSNAALLTALGEGDSGSGDFRVVVNRETGSDVGSVVFQTGYVGSAEIGLVEGGEDWEIRASSDGSSWITTLRSKTDGTLQAGSIRTFDDESYWNAGNDGAGSGLDADLLDGHDGDFYRDAGNFTAGILDVARLPASVLPVTSTVGSGAFDWNTLTSEGWSSVLAFGNSPNGPGGAKYYHLLVVKHTTGALTQIAIPYGATLASLTGNAAVFMRGIYSDSWTAWQRISFEARNDERYVLATAYTAADVLAKLLAVDGSGSGLEADKVSTYVTGSLPSAPARGAGAMILVTGVSPSVIAYSDGTSWRRVTDAAVIT